MRNRDDKSSKGTTSFMTELVKFAAAVVSLVQSLLVLTKRTPLDCHPGGFFFSTFFEAYAS